MTPPAPQNGWVGFFKRGNDMKKAILIILAVIVLMPALVACSGERSFSKGSEDLEKKGYTVAVDKTGVPALIFAETGVTPTCLLMATKDGDSLFAFYFRSGGDAGKAYDYIKQWAKGKLEDAKVTKNGSCIYFGTAQALKDFK